MGGLEKGKKDAIDGSRICRKEMGVTVGFGGMQGRGKEWDVDIILSQPAVSIWYECDDW